MESQSETRPSTPAPNEQRDEQTDQEQLPSRPHDRSTPSADAAPRGQTEGTDWSPLVNVGIQLFSKLASAFLSSSTGSASFSFGHDGSFGGHASGFGGRCHSPVRQIITSITNRCYSRSELCCRLHERSRNGLQPFRASEPGRSDGYQCRPARLGSPEHCSSQCSPGPPRALGPVGPGNASSLQPSARQLNLVVGQFHICGWQDCG